jgi:dephospho-CoA kinase
MNAPPSAARKPTIGLTGGIASGKSTVARILADAGAAVVDADRVARDVVAVGSEGLAEVARVFGPDVLASDGSLNREALAGVVFADDAARARLQAILHPRIGRRSAQLIEELRASDATYVIYDAPLLVEVGAHEKLDALIVVAAATEAQVARAATRDRVAPEEVTRRIAAQLPLERKVEVADYVISNDGSLAELEQRTREVHAEIVARFGLRNRSDEA